MSLELILIQGLNLRNSHIIELMDTCEHALYYINPESIISMSAIPYTSPLTPWDEHPIPISLPQHPNPFAEHIYQEHQKSMQEAMKNPYEEYKADPYAALSQPITQASLTPIVPMSAISTPSFLKPINPILDGGLTIGKKSTFNTVILKEELGYGFKNTYVHHDGSKYYDVSKSIGRMELDLKTPWMTKGKKIFDYKEKEWE